MPRIREQTWSEEQPTVNAEDASTVPDDAGAVHQVRSTDDYIRSRIYYESDTRQWFLETEARGEDGGWDMVGSSQRDSWKEILEDAYLDPDDVERPQMEAIAREYAKAEANALRELREAVEEHEDNLRPDSRNQLQETIERHLTHATDTVAEL